MIKICIGLFKFEIMYGEKFKILYYTYIFVKPYWNILYLTF